MIRDLALSSEYYENRGPLSEKWAGVVSKNNYWTPIQQAEISSLLGEGIYPSDDTLNGHFRISKKGDKGSQHIHCDPKAKDWAGVVYLSLPEDYTVNGKILDSGTKFWSHKASGLTKAPLNSEDARLLGVETLEDLVKFFETEGTNESLWNLEFNVPIKFNRAVFFKPWLWHSYGELFGNNMQNSRLTYLFFLNRYNRNDLAPL